MPSLQPTANLWWKGRHRLSAEVQNSGRRLSLDYRTWSCVATPTQATQLPTVPLDTPTAPFPSFRCFRSHGIRENKNSTRNKVTSAGHMLYHVTYFFSLCAPSISQFWNRSEAATLCNPFLKGRSGAPTTLYKQYTSKMPNTGTELHKSYFIKTISRV